MKPTTTYSLGAVYGAALFSCLFAIAAQAELDVPLGDSAQMGSAKSASAQKAQQAQQKAQQQNAAGSAGGGSSRNLNFTSSNTVKGNINAANGAQVNVGGLDLGGGKGTAGGGGTASAGGGGGSFGGGDGGGGFRDSGAASTSGNTSNGITNNTDSVGAQYLISLSNAELKELSGQDLIDAFPKPSSMPSSDLRYIANHLTMEEVIELDRYNVAEFDKQSPPLSRDSYDAAKLDRIMTALSEDTGLGERLECEVYEDSNNNAQALSFADGSIRLSSTMLKSMNDDELYFFLAHEIGHMENHDSFSNEQEKYRFLAGLAEKGNTDQQNYLAAYNQDMNDYKFPEEYAADKFAYDLMLKSDRFKDKNVGTIVKDALNNYPSLLQTGANTAGVGGILRTLDKLGSPNPAEALSGDHPDHPTTQQREENLNL
jgi:hypothetical protein